MADLGAEVIKIEKPGTGDSARSLGPFPNDTPDPEKSGLFLYLNTNKRGITLNLKTGTGKKIFKELVKDTDILVENFQPRVMPSLGLDYETLKEINPGLVMASISNFGQTGPYRDYKAVEINLAALGGSMYITGDPNREPLKEPASTFQFAAGADACGATLTALYYKKRTGTGQHVDLSIMESIVSCLGPQALVWPRTGLRVKRSGPYSAASVWPGAVASNGTYPCKDGHVNVVCRNSEDAVLAGALTGIEETGSPQIGYFFFGKAVQSEKFNQLLLQGLADMTKDDIFHSAQNLRLFWTSVKDIEEVVNWEQYRERGFWVEIDHPRAGSFTYARTPFNMSQTPVKVGRAPLLGEHNSDIYCHRLGFSPADLATLRELNVI